MTARLLLRGRLPVSFFFLFTWNVEFAQTFAFKFVCHKRTSIFKPNFLVRKRWLHETTQFFYANKRAVVNNPSSTKLSFSKWKNAVLNPSKSFLALKKSTLGFCQLLKDRSLKKWENTEHTHYPLARGWILLDSPR